MFGLHNTSEVHQEYFCQQFPSTLWVDAPIKIKVLCRQAASPQKDTGFSKTLKSPSPTCTSLQGVSGVNNPPGCSSSYSTTQNILVDDSKILLPWCLPVSLFHIKYSYLQMLLSSYHPRKERPLSAACWAPLTSTPRAQQISLHLISMQWCQRGFCSEWQTRPQITWESSPLNLLQLCLANKRQEAHIHYCWLVRVTGISSQAHGLTGTLNIDNQTHLS